MILNPYTLLNRILTAVNLLGARLDAIQKQLERGERMATQLDTDIAALQASVAALTTAETSAVALINGFSAQLAAAVTAAQASGATPTQLSALTALQHTIDQNTAALAAAVAANTPAATPTATGS